MSTRVGLVLAQRQILLVTMLAAWGCGARPLAAPPPSAGVSGAALGPGDVFEVRVFGEPDLTGVYRVADDGTISFPLAGKLEVLGLTASAAGDAVARALARYVRQPSVSVFVREYNSKKVYVFGEVKKPGTFPYREGMSIIEGITLAGGLERLADAGAVSVTRTVDGRERRLTVAVDDIGEGKAPNFTLEPGDIVWVPESIF